MKKLNGVRKKLFARGIKARIKKFKIAINGKEYDLKSALTLLNSTNTIEIQQNVVNSPVTPSKKGDSSKVIIETARSRKRLPSPNQESKNEISSQKKLKKSISDFMIRPIEQINQIHQ